MTQVEAPTILDVENVNGYPRYSPAELERRHSALEAIMDARGVDVAIVGGATGILETSVQYFTNWPPLVESYLVYPRNGDPSVIVRLWNHLPDAQRISPIADVRYGGDTPREQAETVADMVKAAGPNRVGFIGPVRYADMELFKSRLGLAPDDVVDLNLDYQKLRLIKSDEEMHFMRIASAMNDKAVAAMEAHIKPGMKEYELARIIEDTYLHERGTNLIHFTLSTSMSDPHVCVPHQYHPDRTIQSGDAIVTEISTTFWGYAGQILRTFTVDAEPTPLYQEMHDLAVKVYEDLRDALKPGTTVGEIMDRAQMIHDAGYTIWDDLVHGFGGAYLPPILRTRETRGATHPDDFAYEAGTVLVVQPNVITPDAQAGVQVGNVLHITEHGAVELQDYPVKLIRCG
jgi:Xaa-Pro aminopeptidase